MSLMASRPQLIAFDLDGTLIDSVPDLATAVNRALTDLDAPTSTEDDIRRWIGNGAQVLVQRAWCQDAHGEQLSDLQDPNISALYERFLYHYDACKGDATRCYPGVKAALQQLHEHSIPMAIITNKPERFVGPILKSLQLDDYFGLILGGDTLAERKPHPLPLLHAAQHFDVNPTHCWMVGDSRNDILAAKAAGFFSIGVPYGYNHGEPIEAASPDLVVDSLISLV